MPITATYRILLDTPTGFVYNINSSGEAAIQGGISSQSTFKPTTFEVTRNIETKDITIELPRLNDSYLELTQVLASDSLQADVRARYSIIINGVERILLYGRISKTVYTDSSIKLTISSFTENLSYGRVEKISSICRNQFGDLRCGFDRSTVTSSFVIDTISDDRLSFTVVGGGLTAQQFQDGTVVFDSVIGRTVEFDIAVNNETEVFMWETVPAVVIAGSTISLIQGCLKTETACRTYNNFERFGGLPSSVNFSPTLLQSIASAGGS